MKNLFLVWYLTVIVLTYYTDGNITDTVVHSQTKIVESPGLIRKDGLNLDQCAQACLAETAIKCQFFKYINSSKTCYLSETDRSHVQNVSLSTNLSANNYSNGQDMNKEKLKKMIDKIMKNTATTTESKLVRQNMNEEEAIKILRDRIRDLQSRTSEITIDIHQMRQSQEELEKTTQSLVSELHNGEQASILEKLAQVNSSIQSQIKDTDKISSKVIEKVKKLQEATEGLAPSRKMKNYIETIAKTELKTKENLRGLNEKEGALDSKISDLGQDLISFKQIITKEGFQSMQSKLLQLENQFQAMESDINVLSNPESAMNQKFQEDLKILQTLIREVKTSQSKTENDVQTNAGEIVKMMKTLTNLQIANQKYLGDINVIKQSNEDLRTQLDSLTKEKIKTPNIVDINKVASDLQVQMGSLNNKQQGLVTKAEAFKSELKTLLNGLQQKFQKFKDQQKQLDLLKKFLKTTNTDLEKNKGEIKAIEGKESMQQSKVEAVLQKQHKIQSSVYDLRRITGTLKQKMKNLSNDHFQKKMKLQSLVSINKAVDGKLNPLQKRIDTLQKVNVNLKKQILKLQKKSKLILNVAGKIKKIQHNLAALASKMGQKTLSKTKKGTKNRRKQITNKKPRQKGKNKTPKQRTNNRRKKKITNLHNNEHLSGKKLKKKFKATIKNKIVPEKHMIKMKTNVNIQSKAKNLANKMRKTKKLSPNISKEKGNEKSQKRVTTKNQLKEKINLKERVSKNSNMKKKSRIPGKMLKRKRKNKAKRKNKNLIEIKENKIQSNANIKSKSTSKEENTLGEKTKKGPKKRRRKTKAKRKNKNMMNKQDHKQISSARGKTANTEKSSQGKKNRMGQIVQQNLKKRKKGKGIRRNKKLTKKTPQNENKTKGKATGKPKNFLVKKGKKGKKRQRVSTKSKKRHQKNKAKRKDKNLIKNNIKLNSDVNSRTTSKKKNILNKEGKQSGHVGKKLKRRRKNKPKSKNKKLIKKKNKQNVNVKGKASNEENNSLSKRVRKRRLGKKSKRNRKKKNNGLRKKKKLKRKGVEKIPPVKTNRRRRSASKYTKNTDEKETNDHLLRSFDNQNAMGFLPRNVEAIWMSAVKYNPSFQDWVWENSGARLTYDKYFSALPTTRDAYHDVVCNEFRINWFGHWNHFPCKEHPNHMLPVVCIYTGGIRE